MENNEQQPEESRALEITQWVLQKAIGGVRAGRHTILAPGADLSERYRRRMKLASVDEVIDELIRIESAKNFTVGFLSGLGGLLALPVAISSDLAASWLIQLRMVAAIAHLRGYDLQDPRVQTAMLMTLVADSAKGALTKIGLKITNKAAGRFVAQIPLQMIRGINAKVGFMLLARGGTRAAIKLVNLVPIAGGIVNGAIDGSACFGIGSAAKSFFPERGDEGLAAAT